MNGIDLLFLKIIIPLAVMMANPLSIDIGGNQIPIYAQRTDPLQVIDSGATLFMQTDGDTIGLLAHSAFSGMSFSRLHVGEVVWLNYTDRRVKYAVQSIEVYEAQEPKNGYSMFRKSVNDQWMTAEELHRMMYIDGAGLTLQTCVEKNGEVSWGRMFVKCIELKY